VRFKDNELFPSKRDATNGDARDSQDASSESDGARNDATEAGDGPGLDEPELEACPQACERPGDFKCLDQATLTLCVPSTDGCSSWQPVGPCPSGHVCCAGLCLNDDLTLPERCVETLPDGYDYYVSASAPNDAGEGDGSRDNPFRTISKVLDVASKRPRSVESVIKIFVARGTYDGALGEDFPLVVPGGVSLQGAGAPRTVIAGSHVYDTSVRGGAAGDVFVLTMVVGDVNLPTTIAGFTVVPGDAAPGSKTHFGIYCDLGAPLEAGQAAFNIDPNTTLRDLVVGPRYFTPIVATHTATTQPACSLRLIRSTILGGQMGLWARPGLADQKRAIVLGDGKPDGGNVFKLQSMPDSTGTSLLAAGRVSVAGWYNLFTNSDRGANIVGIDTYDLLRENHFEQISNYGIRFAGNSVLELRNNTFANISMNHFSSGLGGAAALEITGASNAYPAVTARDNRFFANDTGVRFGQLDAVRSIASSDFGTSDTSPGGNEFFCNGVADDVMGEGVGGSVVVDLPDLATNLDFFFRGNRWNGDRPSVTYYQSATGWIRGDVMLRDTHARFHAENPGAPFGETCPDKPR
jgi:hypothetical protein